MTDEVIINGTGYTYTTQVQGHPAHREAFFRLARQVFQLDFAPWHAAGWWDAGLYLPHLLLQDGQAVANVSASRMAFATRPGGGEAPTAPRQYLQLGTVMVCPAARGRGLAGWLMERVVTRFAGGCDGIYLLANDTVLGFYPKYGFAPAPQATFSGSLGPLVARQAPPAARRLDPANPEDAALLLRCYRQGNPHAALYGTGNPGLLMFHAAGPLREGVWYLPEADTAFIAEREGSTLHLMDVYDPAGLPLAAVAGAAAAALPGAATLRLGFTPTHTAGMAPGPAEEGSTLFLHQGGEDLFTGRQLMMPVLTHA